MRGADALRLRHNASMTDLHHRRTGPVAVVAVLVGALSCSAERPAEIASEETEGSGAQPLSAVPAVVIDGRFDDWAGVAPALVDPVDAVPSSDATAAESAASGAAAAGIVPGDDVDIRAVHVVDDPTAVYLRIDFEDIVNVKGLGGGLDILLDADADDASGWSERGTEGVDLVVELSPHDPRLPGVPGAGVAVRTSASLAAAGPGGAGGWPAGRTSAYAVDLLMAPNVASRTYEIRLARGIRLAGVERPLFTAERLRARLVAFDVAGGIRDETGTIEYRFAHAAIRVLSAEVPSPDPASATSPGAPAAPDARAGLDDPAIPGAVVTPGTPAVVLQSPAATDPLARTEGTSLRVVSWNVARNSLVERREAVGRILAALDPDLLLLDEVTAQVDGEWIRELLAGLPGDRPGSWNVAFGGSGDDERCVLASRQPLERVEAFEGLAYGADFRRDWLAGIDDPDRRRAQAARLAGTIPVAGARLEFGGARLLAVALDLACCGDSLDGPEERRRRFEAERLRSVILEVLAAGTFEGLVVGGDLNLVGTLAPLEILVDELDPGGGRLASAEPLQLDGLSNATWSGPGQPFPPGRLDYQLYSASTLEVAGSFVFESADLGEPWLQRHGLQADDTARASDHMPVVVDYRLRRR